MNSNFFARLFIPREKKFYDLFEQDTINVCAIADSLMLLVNEADEEKRKEIKNKMHDVEHANDQLTHIVMEELSRNFITPFDREDIHSLISSLDDVTDFIYVSAKSMLLYKIDPTQDIAIQSLADLIRQATKELDLAIKGLRDFKGVKQSLQAVVQVNSIENQADDILYTGIEHLFEHEQNAIEIIKKRDLYYQLETVTDKCEDVCDIIENILIKYS
ncbi:DUF47 domain-containing protein [Microbacter margulisiae]|uniref:Phosphate transport regulator n=1 Tax=Microbacter margulisiae TaxID=1350067 RepID=A0A7W5H1A6_9PORP|nr:DUF47 family protein [Microbacter margulisiae]MBB3186156.1 hypothetical protein [Microbacter margulisiae]